MRQAEVMDLTTVCQSFPEIPEPLISRDNILDTLDTLFMSGTELIVVEGEEGIGKTTLLIQFALRYPDHALSLFVKPASRWAYDPELLRFDLCNQIQWILCREELVSLEYSNDASLRQGLTSLHKLTRYHRESFYFIVDGLAEIPEQASHTINFVLDMLPLGFSGFRFLLSGSSDQLLTLISRTIRMKPFTLSGFTFDETTRYFDNFDNVDRHSLQEVHQICRKIPGRMTSIKRIMQSGIDIRTVLDERPDELEHLFAIEWRRVQCEDDNQLIVLAILAHDPKKRSIEDLARILKLETTMVNHLLDDLSFVSVDPQCHEAKFVSESFRKYAVAQLKQMKDQVIDLLISDLYQDPDSVRSRTHLPEYLQQAGRLDDILDYLSPEHFPKMLELGLI